MREELNDIDEIIKSTNYYKENLTEKEQKEVLKSNNWVINKNKKKKEAEIRRSIGEITYLSIFAGIDEGQANYFYKYLSNYTHFESYALKEFSIVEDYEIWEDAIDKAVRSSCMFLALALGDFCNIIPRVKSEIGILDKETRKHIKYIINVHRKIKGNPIKDIWKKQKKIHVL